MSDDEFQAQFSTRMAEISNLILLEESNMAIKVQQADRRGNKVVAWIPKSQIDYQRKTAKNSDGFREIVIHIPDWLSDAKGLA